MSSWSLQITLLIFLTLLCLQHSSVEKQWRTDRQPKIMGDKIPWGALSPRRRRIQRKIVAYHNYFRTKVSPPAANMLRMRWHKGAALAAQRWANECMLLTHDNADGRFIKNFGSCGQNIFVASHQVPWLFAIKSWWLEKDEFVYGGSNNDLMVIGHYTQMVWATTHKVGCGFNYCDRVGNVHGRKYFSYVCNYCPIGNSPGKLGRPYRRGRPCATCRNSCHAQKLCTNACPVADYWANCRELFATWPAWLCHSGTPEGKERAGFCRATCKCKGKVQE